MKARPILLVEDNPDDEELILLALKDNQISNNIVVARDGVEALDYLFASGHYAGRDVMEIPALVMLDLKLPKLNGLDVLQRIRNNAHTRTVPVVILTSSNEATDLLTSYELGVNSFIRKPIEFEEFQKVVRQLGFYWLLTNKLPEA